MKLSSLTCPNCGAVLNDEDHLDTFFCKFCGYRIVREEMDEATLKAKVSVNRMRHIENLVDKGLEHARYKTEKRQEAEKHDTKVGLLILGVILLGCALIIGGMAISEANDKKAIEKIYDQAVEYINEGDYDKALLEANKLYYEGDDETEKDWDERRETLIELIEEKKKEAESR